MHNAARVLEMEANALIVSAAAMRACAARIVPGEVRRFLYEEAALFEETASNRAEEGDVPSAESGRLGLPRQAH